MSESVIASYERNPLLIDKFGSFVNLIRKNNEDINSYKERVMKAYKELYELDNESFWRSLSYITTYGEKNIGFLDVTIEDKTRVTIELNNERLTVAYNDTKNLFEFKKYKFLIDLVEEIKNTDGLEFEFLNTDDTSWHYLYSKNLIPKKSDKILLKKTINSFQTKSPRENTLDFNYWFEKFLSNPYVDNNNIFSETKSLREGYSNYKDIPILFTWSPFLVLSCNKEEFKNIIKDDNGNLTQRGAKVINKILEKQNTYWGE